jgi:hypothetical protein
MRNAVQGDITRAAERIQGILGDTGDTTCGYLIAPVRLTAEVVEAAYRMLGSSGETIDAFIDKRGGEAALRDAVGAILSGAKVMAIDPARMTANALGAAAPLIPGLLMRWNEIHLGDEFLFYISAEMPGTTTSWRHSNWRERLIERMQERRRDQVVAMHQEMRNSLDDIETQDLDDAEYDEWELAHEGMMARRRLIDRRIEVVSPEALISAHEDDDTTPQWIGIDLGDCRLEDGRLNVRTGAPWHAPDRIIEDVAQAVERMLDVVSESGGTLDMRLSERRRQIVQKLHDVPQASLLDVKVRSLSQNEGGMWTGQVNVISDVKALDTFGVATDLRIHDHGYETSDKGMPKSIEGLVEHQRRIVATMAQEHRHSPFTVEAVLAKAMALLDTAGLARALRTPAATAGGKARALGLPPEYRTIEASKGRISGRIALSPTVSYRDGTLKARGVSLPQAAIATLPGRPVSALLESPLLGEATIRTARSTKDGIVVKIDAGPDVRFDDIVDACHHADE